MCNGRDIARCRQYMSTYLILKKCATLPTITFYDMNAMGIGQMVLYLAINISANRNLYSHRIIIYSATLVSKYDTIVSMRIALQSYNELDGIVIYFFRIRYM